jgi:hypothetical protein
MDILYIVKYWYEIQEQKKFWYGAPVYTDPFRALYLCGTEWNDLHSNKVGNNTHHKRKGSYNSRQPGG